MAKKEYKEVITPPEANGGIKFDSDKLDWSLLPWDVIETVVRRYHVGKAKYAAWSWTKLENGKERYESAMMRHFMEYKKGNRWDEDPRFQGEFKSSHLQASLWNMMCLVWYELREIEEEEKAKEKAKK